MSRVPFLPTKLNFVSSRKFNSKLPKDMYMKATHDANPIISESLSTCSSYSAPRVLSPWISIEGMLWVKVVAKVQFARFGKIMGALIARVACPPLFSLYPLGSLVLLSTKAAWWS
ncbi:uncharacterized protein LOC126614308 isoform X1 [Malus sylvestris]|uniref:uncharacterized protein LOC126614308 isoform X1 n=1 Tax=Malus sylvestris TaxID=3752 RepID=UPI0021AC833C|nr:uncharacterized protein LOC126614308 isoform X1 [Malus sylvestris]